MRWFIEIKKLVENCKLCNYIDKPYIVYRVYELYTPEKIDTLIISESPPPGYKEDFLYNLNHSDRLRSSLKRFMGFSSDGDLMKFFVENNVFWDMAVRCRPRSKQSIVSMARNCSYITKLVIEYAKPNTVLLLGKTAQKQFKEIEKNLLYRPKKIVFEKHPLYITRFERDRASEYFNSLRNYIVKKSD